MFRAHGAASVVGEVPVRLAPLLDALTGFDPDLRLRPGSRLSGHVDACAVVSWEQAAKVLRVVRASGLSAQNVSRYQVHVVAEDGSVTVSAAVTAAELAQHVAAAAWALDTAVKSEAAAAGEVRPAGLHAVFTAALPETVNDVLMRLDAAQFAAAFGRSPERQDTLAALLLGNSAVDPHQRVSTFELDRVSGLFAQALQATPELVEVARRLDRQRVLLPAVTRSPGVSRLTARDAS
jgi:hypothetical protein